MADSPRSASAIAQWPESERPRERLLSRGAEALTDAELLAILLRTGIRGTSAVEMGRELLERFGSLRNIAQSSQGALLETKGLKTAKAAQLMAAMEIARRIETGNRKKHIRFTGATQTSDYLRRRLRDLPDEHFRVLYLNRQNALLEDSLISQGDVARVPVSIRKIVTRALLLNASSIIAAHNHPAGAAMPSESDRHLTGNLINATKNLDIKVLDHIIVAGEDIFSFAGSGMLDELEFNGFADAAAHAPPPLRR